MALTETSSINIRPIDDARNRTNYMFCESIYSHENVHGESLFKSRKQSEAIRWIRISRVLRNKFSVCEEPDSVI